VWSL